MNEGDINDFFGDMDLFLMDLLLKGTLEHTGTLLDIGCGSGRNLVYFLHRRWQIWGVDTDRSQLELLRYMFSTYPDQEPSRMIEASVESLPLDSQQFDLVICSRVMHLLPSVKVFRDSWQEIHRVLKPGGLLYFSMNSTINFESKVLHEGETARFNDGTQGLFLSAALIPGMEQVGYDKIMPHRTVHFDDQHAETTLILRKQ